jgi:hypothetical protein
MIVFAGFRRCILVFAVLFAALLAACTTDSPTEIDQTESVPASPPDKDSSVESRPTTTALTSPISDSDSVLIDHTTTD